MNECLEAIKRLKWGLDITQEERINLCECIEKELKEYQEIKSYMQQYGIENIEELRRVLHNNWVICQKFKTDTANVAKALEIIGDIFTLKEIVVNGKEHYCSLYDRRTHSETPLTKKEYDLLKEILP